MAQPKLEYITLRVSEKIGDQVTVASTNGELKTAAKRLQAINEARSNIYNSLYNSIGSDRFIGDYKEFIKTSGTIALTDLVGTKPANVKKMISLRFWDDFDSDSVVATPVPVQNYYEAQYDTHSVYFEDSQTPQFLEFSTTFKILGGALSDNNAEILYLEDIVPAVQGGANADIPDPYSWFPQIISEAAKILLTDQQIYN